MRAGWAAGETREQEGGGERAKKLGGAATGTRMAGRPGRHAWGPLASAGASCCLRRAAQLANLPRPASTSFCRSAALEARRSTPCASSRSRRTVSSCATLRFSAL